MALPRLVIETLLLPTLALIVPLLYALAWAREVRANHSLRRAPVLLHRRPVRGVRED